jgi:WD40 repeat protein
LAVSKSGELAVSLHPRFLYFDAGRGTLARVAALGGTPRELATDVEYADWGPDGEQLAIARLSKGVGRLEFPVGHVLFQSSGWVSHPRVSPSGDRIAFINHPEAGNSGGEVAVVDLQGHTEVRSRGWENVLGLAWAPDGQDVWFAANRGEDVISLWADSPGGRQRLLYRGVGNALLSDVTASGTMLVSEGDWRQELEVQTEGHPASKPSDTLDWSRLCCTSADGKTVVWDESGWAVANRSTVFLRKSDELSPVKLGEGSAIGLSPDGKWVVAFREDTPGKLWLLPTGAGESRALDVPQLPFVARGAFFPDGQRLAVLARESANSPLRLFVVDVDTAKVHALTPATLPSGTSPVSVSLDGKFVATVGQDLLINLARTDGGEPVQLSQLGGGQYPAGWLSDGSLVASGNLELPAPVRRLDLATGKLTVLKTVSPNDPAGVERVTRLQVTPDGRTMFLNYRRMSNVLYTLGLH